MADQFSDPPTATRCARVAPQEVHYDGRRKDPGLCDLGLSDGGIVSGGEFERSCGMSSRSEDVPDLSSFRQGVEKRRTHRVAGRARSVARRSLSRIAALLSRPVRHPRHRVAGDRSEFGPPEFDCRGVIRDGVILLHRGPTSQRDAR
jgi:hypothetical protein